MVPSCKVNLVYLGNYVRYISHVCSLAALKILIALFVGGLFQNSYFSDVIFSFVVTDVKSP